MDNFELEIIEGIAVVKIANTTATLKDAPFLWDLFESELVFDWKKIIIDLSLCTFVDSTFIGMIVKIFRRANDNDNHLKLVFPQITDINSFSVAGITRILECFSTLQNAVESFKPEASISKIVIDREIFTN
jgi:anti-anti-sigma regulatory factor